MAMLKIEGQHVRVDDSFLEMSPEEQHTKVDEIGKALKIQNAGVKGGPGYIENALKPITSYPETWGRMASEGREQISRGFDQITHPDSLTDPKAHGLSDVLKGAGNMALGTLAMGTSPINAAIDSFVGKPIEENVGVPAEYTDFAASMALPMPKRMPKIGPVRSSPAVTHDPLGVTLSEGQATGDLSAIQREQAAARGQSGPPAQRKAQEFLDQQKGQLETARTDIATGLDPAGQRIAESPQAAGEVVSEQLQRAAAQRKAGVTAAYDEAKSYPGEIHANAFVGLPTKIKTDLSARPDPIIIDDKLTPFASRAIEDIDARIGQLKIQNRADPRGQPNPQDIVGVDLKGVDQMRKRLSTFRKDAYSSGNGADGRAAKAVLDAFDDHIEAAINGGLFRGDPRAIGAWNDARAFYADYRKTFTAGKNDPVGRVVEKILAKGDNAQTPNAVADFMYGSPGVNPTSLNVGVVSRLKSTFGDRSPEWSAIKQGLFSRIVEAGEGSTPLGPGKVAQRLNKFLNSDGKEMSALVFSQAERDLFQKYADLMRKLEVPQAGANWSNSATFTVKALDKIGGQIGATMSGLIGSGLAHAAGLPFGIAEGIGGPIGVGAAKGVGAIGNAMQARAVAKQMPIIGKVMTDYQNAAMAFETSPSARTVARLSIASRNLSSNLKDIGISFSPENLMRAIQGPRPAGADQEQR